MGTTASTSKTAASKEMIPPWVYTVKIPPEFASDALGACSDGMNLVGPNTVVRSRKGVFDTDGARWSRGFTSGKHTFEVVYPMAHRGSEAAVGVGTEDAPLHAKGRVVLVGHNKFSWGICLRTRRSFHKGAIVKKYPQTQVYLPDKFYMYLDADAGTLQFGSDLEYYGAALNGIPRQQPLYPMVGACMQGCTITMVYRGKGNTQYLAPAGSVIVAGSPVNVVTPGAPGVHTVTVVQPPPPMHQHPDPYYPNGPPPYSAHPPPPASKDTPPSDWNAAKQESKPSPLPPPAVEAASDSSSQTSDTSFVGPPPPCVVPAGPQMMSPNAPRSEPPPPPPPTVVSSNPEPEPEPEPVPQKEPEPVAAEPPAPEPEAAKPEAEKEADGEKAPE